ncbi:Verru_Chthon cassette protein C [Verrucomicrobium sp. GAS474]|uniref:prepilin-type N-terminal cleavage/methylation domain-containing protein n=1 Tax=Verrucomicrobium sp. GAS474 TaxID=1882831 RepID=UPI00087BFF64|nr:prepilin-type N-terminal cleavage/methylation domain-containing protein [Verrucomicrobium sp. GAS474]SDU02664.1 Verru_Chthon cassette protein C [Verrucomicrobium sp. GAS474]
MLPRPATSGGRGFTLTEILVAVAVLSILMLLMVSVMNASSSASRTAQNRLDSEGQARLAITTLDRDLAQVIQSPDVDFFVDKSSLNDRIFFYSETPGYPSGSSTPSNVSLVGYRINATSGSASYNQLERYGAALQWDGAMQEGLRFLTYPTGAVTSAPVASTRLSADAVTASGSSDSRFHVLAADVFRFELCYQLRDGTYSTVPILTFAPSTWLSGTFYTAAAAPPSPQNGAPTYQIGSRWYDGNGKQGYICVNAVAPAVWRAVGWQDVTAVVVTIATLDTANRRALASSGRNLDAAAALFPKTAQSDLQSSPAILPGTKWLQILSGPTLSSSLPSQIAAAIHVYQRYLYLNAP